MKEHRITHFCFQVGLMTIEHNRLSHGIVVLVHPWFCALYSSRYEVIYALFLVKMKKLM